MAFTTHDNAPYLYRRSGGGGDKEIDKLVGGTIAWNQQMIISSTGNREMLGLTITNNQDGSLSIVGTATSGAFNYWLWGGYGLATELFTVVENHKYFTKSVILFGNTSVLLDGDKKISDTFGNISKATRSASVTGVRMANQTPNVTYNLKVYPMVCDLTLMFGSTIADYVYSLEQSSQGSGLAWLRSYGFFTEDYYDYNSGELKSVSNLVSHDMTGKNLARIRDVNATFGGITWQSDGASIRVKGTATSNSSPFVGAQVTNFDTMLNGVYPVGTYTVSCRGWGMSQAADRMTVHAKYADGTGISEVDGTRITPSTVGGQPNDRTFTATKPFKLDFWCNIQSGSTVDFTATIQLEFGSTATSHEPYTLHSYPLGDVTLRGLPKLNGNALYYDGDTYESNGTVTRKYGVVDMGTLTWAYDSSAHWITSSSLPNGVVATVAGVPNAIANVDSTIVDRLYLSAVDKGWTIYNGRFFKKDISLSEADLRATITGKTLVYELETPTTETADTYTNPQWVDPNGTERYTLSASAFPMPVGHETTYNTDMGSKTVNTQVNLSMTEPSVRQIYAKEGDTARVLNIHLDQTEEDGTLRILRPDGTEVTAEAVLVPEFYDGLMAEIPSDATSVVGKCYCDVEQNGVSSMPFTLNVKKNERAT